MTPKTAICKLLLPAVVVFAVAPANVRGQFRFANQMVTFSEASFDKSTFDRLTMLGARKKCEDSLQAELEHVAAAMKLGPEQMKKLELAGRIDIHRFFEEYKAIKRTLPFGTVNRDQWQATFGKAQEAVGPLRERFTSGLHGEDSLFMKAIHSTLGESQRRKLASAMADQALETYRNQIRVTLALLDRRTPMTEDQRSRILDLMVRKTEPIRGDAYFQMKVLTRMGQVEEELRQILTPEEWEVWKTLIGMSSKSVEKGKL